MTAVNRAAPSLDAADSPRWERLLSGEGGDVIDFQFGEHEEIIAITPLGLFRSSDGERWIEIDVPPLVRALHRAGSWWLGTDFGLFRADSLEGPWQPMLSGGAVTGVSAGEHGDLVLAATLGEGLLRSEDCGSTWDDANPGLPGDDIVAIHRSPAFEQDQTIFVATESGVFRSRNNGRAWRQVGPDIRDIQCFAVYQNQLLIGTQGDGLWMSPDNGRTWHTSFPGEEIIGVGPSATGGTVVFTGSGLRIVDTSGAVLSRTLLPPDAFSAIETGNRTLIGTMGRGVLQLIPGEERWVTSSTGLEATPRDRVLTIEGAWIVTTSGAGTIVHSADGGASWSELAGGPLEAILDFDAQVTENNGLEIVACDGRFAGVYRGAWQRLDVQSPVAVAWLEHEPAVITADGRFICGEIRAPIAPERLRLTGARLLAVPGQPALLWSVLHTDNSGVFILRSADGGKRWELLLQTDTTGAVSLAVTIDGMGNEVALLGARHQVYRPLESPEPVWTGDDTLAVSAIAVHPEAGVLLATSHGLITASLDFAASELVFGSPMPLLDVGFEVDGGAIVIERGGSIWRFRRA